MPDQKDGGISWTDTTWNPLVGCSRVSEGCRHCYAEVMAARVANAAQARLREWTPLTAIQAAYRQVVMWERGGMDPADYQDVAKPKWNGRVALIESRLAEPLTWTRPRLVFVNSMSDLFHETLMDGQIEKIVTTMALANRHTFQVLTKRPERMAAFLNGLAMGRDKITCWDGRYHQMVTWPLPNVWWGTSAEDQKTLDDRAKHLMACRKNAAVLWLSLEPLLGPVTMRKLPPFIAALGAAAIECQHGFDCCPDCDRGIDWVVTGFESGGNARPGNPAWARQNRDECQAAGVPWHFKQWGEFGPVTYYQHPNGFQDDNFNVHQLRPNQLAFMDHTHQTVGYRNMVGRIGKKAAGRLLDGVLHDAMPVGFRREKVG